MAFPTIVPVVVDNKAEFHAANMAGPTFRTEIHVDGDAGKKIGTSRHAILPFFAAPVQAQSDANVGGANRLLDEADEAYLFGVTSLDSPTWLSDDAKAVSSAGARIIKDIGEQIGRCAAERKKAGLSALKIDVQGFASPRWFRPVKDPNDLNLNLAEGRRNAVIQALGLSDFAARHKEYAGMDLGDMVDFKGGVPPEFSTLAELKSKAYQKTFRFSKDEMAEERKGWIAKADTESSDEILARSVIMTFDDKALANCSG